MLNSFRAFSGNLIIKAMLLLLVLSFGLWGVGDVLRVHGSNAPVAVIGNNKITQQQFIVNLRKENETMQKMLGKQYTPELAASIGLPERVLQRMVRQHLLSMESDDIGIIPSDEDIVKEIRADKSFADNKGQFDKSRFQQILKSIGMSEQKFIDSLRSELGSQQLTDLFNASVPMPDVAVRTLYEARKQQRTATIYRITPALLKAQSEPNNEQLETYYKAHAQEYSVAELRTLSYASIAPSDVPKQAGLSEDEATEQFINKVEDAFAGGSTLAEVAAEFKLKVQKLPAINHNGQTAEGKPVSLPAYDKIIDVAFNMDENTESQLLPTKDGGYAVLRVESITPEHVRPLAEVRPIVLRGWQKQQRSEELARIARDVTNKFKTKEEREAAIREYGLSGSSSGNLKRDEQSELPGILVEGVFTSAIGSATEAYADKNGDYVIAVVSSVVPASLPAKGSSEYAELMRQMRSTLAREQKNEIAEEYFIYLERKFPVDINFDIIKALTAPVK